MVGMDDGDDVTDERRGGETRERARQHGPAADWPVLLRRTVADMAGGDALTAAGGDHNDADRRHRVVGSGFWGRDRRILTHFSSSPASFGASDRL